MRKIVGDERLLTKCSAMYYFEYMTQNEISNILGISRPTVSRLLKEAREKGIVKIQIQNLHESNCDYYQELEQQIEKKYGLLEAIIISDTSDENDLKMELGKATAKYLERVLKDRDIVGVSMGTTLKEVSRFVSSECRVDATFVPLIGGTGQLRMEIHPNQIAMDLSRAFSSKFKLLHAPAVISDLKIKNNFEKEKSLKDVMDFINKTNIAIVGIGAPTEKSTMMATGYFDKNQIKDIKNNSNAVGDICLQFYDINGDYKKFPDNKRVFGIELEKLREIDRVVGVAGGEEKLESIIGAIRGKFINVLVTNYSCAKKMNEYK